jgi:signal peptidase I
VFEKFAKFEIEISRRMLLLFLIAVPLVMMLSLPLFAHTSTYPVATVEGNSMYPALHNGDLIYYAAPRGPVKNGTIIVFIQGESGVNSIDTLLKPIVIHRIVGFGYNPDGSLYYQTKGDNNAEADPFVTPASSILGVETLDVPYLGLPLQFLKSAYGMLTVVAVMCLYYFSGVDTRVWMEDERRRLLDVFARHSLEGSIRLEQFEKLKLVVESKNIPEEVLRDADLLSMSHWLSEGGLGEKWREETGSCPKCGASSYHIVSEEGSFVVCPNCMAYQAKPKLGESSPTAGRSWADRLFTRTSSRTLVNAALQPSHKNHTQCGIVCPTHKVPCALRKDHHKSHHHIGLEGTFCFFD